MWCVNYLSDTRTFSDAIHTLIRFPFLRPEFPVKRQLAFHSKVNPPSQQQRSRFFLVLLTCWGEMVHTLRRRQQTSPIENRGVSMSETLFIRHSSDKKRIRGQRNLTHGRSYMRKWIKSISAPPSLQYRISRLLRTASEVRCVCYFCFFLLLLPRSQLKNCCPSDHYVSLRVC